MKYINDKEVMLGDKVDIGGGMTGTVVCSIEDQLYSDGYLQSKWEHLGKGILVDSEQAGLVHFAEPDIDLVLISRAES